MENIKRVAPGFDIKAKLEIRAHATCGLSENSSFNPHVGFPNNVHVEIKIEQQSSGSKH